MSRYISWASAKISNTQIKKHSKRDLTILIGLILYSWALFIPYGGVADEPTYYHYGTNAFNELFEIRELKSEFELKQPEDVLKNVDQPCFAFNPEISSACESTPSIDTLVSSTPRLIDYPKFFYLFTIWPLFLFPSAVGFLLSKLLAVSISLFMIGIAISIWQKNRTLLFALVLTCLNPLAMHIIAGYNPNAFEISGGLALCIVLFGRAITNQKQKQSFYIILAMIAVFTATAKPYSGILVVGVYAIFIVSYWLQQRQSLFKIFLSLKRETIIIFSALIISVIVSQKATEDSPLKANPDFSSLLKETFLNVPKSVIEYSGIFAWRDSRSPLYLSIIWLTLQLILVILAFKNLRPKTLVVNALALVAVLFLAPFAASVALSSQYNVGLQMRYLLPLLFSLTFLIVMQIPARNLNFAAFVASMLILVGILNLLLLNVRFSIGTPENVSLRDKLIETYFDSSNWHSSYFSLALFFVMLVSIFLIFQLTSIMKLRALFLSLPLTLGVMSMIALSTTFSIQTTWSKSDISLGNLSRPTPVGPISKGTQVEQSFVSNHKDLYAIDLLTATYARANDATYIYELIDENDNLVFDKSLSSRDLKDNSWLRIEFPKISGSEGKTFRLRVYSNNATDSNSITFYYNLGPDLTPESFLELNNSRIDGDLILKLTFESVL
jgi:hypothetical protein